MHICSLYYYYIIITMLCLIEENHFIFLSFIFKIFIRRIVRLKLSIRPWLLFPWAELYNNIIIKLIPSPENDLFLFLLLLTIREIRKSIKHN